MINIHKYDKTLLSQPSILYVGRGKTVEELGLGNPYSHKPTQSARFRVETLSESISSYRKWLFKLIKLYWWRETKSFEAWERDYLKQVLKLSQNVASGKVTGLMCWCINQPNYQPNKSRHYTCHAQLLYAGVLCLERRKKANLLQGCTKLVTPEKVTKLKPWQMLVIGTNYQGPDRLNGRHGAGAAGFAFGANRYPHKVGTVGKWAIYGQAEGVMHGRFGSSYGIPTKNLEAANRGDRSIPLGTIQQSIERFLKWATAHPDIECLVTPIGCNRAGYTKREIANFFTLHPIPPNVALPQEFWNIISAKLSR
jgi:hypothetical protein